MQGYKIQRPMAIGIKEYIWRKGEERCERSAREPDSETETANRNPEKPITIQPMSLTPDGFRQVSTKREEANTKMSERYLVGQATQNPFMSSNNYVNDIEVQMNFLTPQKS
jgi:hypothetical protein